MRRRMNAPMPDLLQPGSLLSLPLLRSAGAKLEADLAEWTSDRILALLLPCHVRDLQSPALAGIVAILAEIPWLGCIVVGLDGAEPSQHAAAVEKFRPLGTRCTVLRHDGPPGKGRNLQACAAHALRDANVFAVAMHDCDIASYSREFLARLCWPVLHPDAGLLACKGCYARSAGGLHGRVFRLLFQPLLRAWAELAPSTWGDFLQSLRYPLAGELCVSASLFPRLEWDPGWGVEVTLLHSLHSAAGAEQLCQAELCSSYDHKHQAPRDLVLMAGEVARVLRDSMPVPAPATLRAVCERHIARALRDSALTAAANGLPLDESSELALARDFLAAAFPAQ